MAAPWMKFYPADWRADPRLRMCSLQARGLWIDLIAYMHEGEPYGYLTLDGAAPSLGDIAALVGRPPAEVRKALAELEALKVFSRKGEAIFSRRMVRDRRQAEADRANGRRGGNPRLREESDGAGVNPPDKAQTPDSRIQIPDSVNRAVAHATRPNRDGFEDFWKAYPKRRGANPKAPAHKLFAAALKAGTDPQDIIAGAQRCAEQDRDKIGTQFIPQAVTWLRDRRWEDYARAAQEGAQTSGAKVFIRQDDPRFAAWLTHLRKASVPIVNGGWYFDSETPPGASALSPPLSAHTSPLVGEVDRPKAGREGVINCVSHTRRHPPP